MIVRPQDLDPAFQRNLRAIRAAKHMSQAALAERIGVPRPQVSRWESGQHSPTLSTITRICEALECEPEDLLGERTEKTLRLQTA